MKKIIFTGGHHTSALPLLEDIRKKDNISVFWIGHKHSLTNDKNETLEYKQITALGIPFTELKTGKIYKRYSIYQVMLVINGIIDAYKELKRINPDLVLSFGGYLAVPVVLAAKLQGIKVITHEQTMVSGYANRLIGFFADKILISWPQSIKYFNPFKTFVVGLPIRPSISQLNSNNFVGRNDFPFIYITAGKSGSVVINKVIEECLEELLTRYNIIHQVGDYSEEKSYEKLSNKYASIQEKVTGNYFLRTFVLENEIGEAFTKASLVVGRSGAHFCAEVLWLKKPAILIPIPWASHNEQMINALYVQESGLGDIILEKDLDPITLISKIDSMFSRLDSYSVKDSQHVLNYSDSVLKFLSHVYEALK